MLQAHSFLWHYLWIAPNLLLLVLGALIWNRGIRKQFPAFLAFAIFGAVGQLAVYTADVSPSVTAETFWRVDWASLVVEGILKFALVGEIFALVFGSHSSLARLGKQLIRGVGIVLVGAAALVAAYTPKDGLFGIVSGAHVLEQTIYLIEAGLLFFIFSVASYFRLALRRPIFGISLGLSISACVHLAAWAIISSGRLPNSMRYRLDFFSMATYHVCVLIWCYYLLVPEKKPVKPQLAPSNPHLGSGLDDLEALNRELEQLLHQ